jgi:hypothetical protein
MRPGHIILPPFSIAPSPGLYLAVAPMSRRISEISETGCRGDESCEPVNKRCRTKTLDQIQADRKGMAGACSADYSSVCQIRSSKPRGWGRLARKPQPQFGRRSGTTIQQRDISAAISYLASVNSDCHSCVWRSTTEIIRQREKDLRQRIAACSECDHWNVRYECEEFESGFALNQSTPPESSGSCYPVPELTIE